jgi:hypothetical protein
VSFTSMVFAGLEFQRDRLSTTSLFLRSFTLADTVACTARFAPDPHDQGALAQDRLAAGDQRQPRHRSGRCEAGAAGGADGADGTDVVVPEPFSATLAEVG